MKIFVIALILLICLIDLVISRGDKINGYNCKESYSIFDPIEFTCDAKSSETVNYTEFFCQKTNKTLGPRYDIEEVSFDCSIPHLNTYLSTYFKGYRFLYKLNLRNIDLLSLEKENLLGFERLWEINLLHK